MSLNTITGIKCPKSKQSAQLCFLAAEKYIYTIVITTIISNRSEYESDLEDKLQTYRIFRDFRA